MTADLAQAPRRKLAEQIARLLEDRILDEEWPIGFAIGNEAELATEAGVSRWTMREAIALLERLGLLESRRGLRGGVFVAASAAEVVGNRLANYLEFIRPTPADLHATHRALSHLGLQRAAQNSAKDRDQPLRQLLGELDGAAMPHVFVVVTRIREAIFQLADARALSLFMSTLSRLRLGAYYRSSLDETSFLALNHAQIDTTRELGAAIIAGDATTALACEDRFILHVDQVYSSSQAIGAGIVSGYTIERTIENYPPLRARKKADRVVEQIRQEIIEAGWPVGRLLGSEAELMARYGVGRAVLREAIRSLEHLGVVEMGRGGASGLRVISPDPHYTIAAVRRHLRHIQIDADERRLLRDALSDARPADPSAPPFATADLFLQILDDPD